MQTVNILGVNVSSATNDETYKYIEEKVSKARKHFIVTANPEIICYAYKNKDYLSSIQKADFVTADGIGVVKGARILGHHIPERVTGVDIFYHLLQVANDNHYSIYLLGATEAVLEKAISNINKQFPNARVTGSHHGFFDRNDDDFIVRDIKAKKPDLIFVALGFPLQESWIARHIDQFEKGIFIGVGGSFNILAGHVKRAPQIWQKFHLEWFYRLLKEPSRLPRMARIPIFIYGLFKQKIGKEVTLDQNTGHNVTNEEKKSL